MLVSVDNQTLDKQIDCLVIKRYRHRLHDFVGGINVNQSVASLRYVNNYIGGEWVAPAGGTTLDVEDPFTHEIRGCAPLSDARDVDAAVAAATTAFASWQHASVAERQRVLRILKAALVDNLEELAMIWSYEVGTPITTARQASAFLPVKVLEDLDRVLDTFAFSQKLDTTRVDRVPVGPIAAITPWNYPLSQLIIKCASAIAAGCTVVAKPSEIAPLCAFRFVELAAERGLPAGLINLVGGDGLTCGTALVSHPGIRLVSFTGSTVTGRTIARISGERLVRTCLELGGKSASLVLDEAILDTALAGTLASCTRNSGQTCTSLTRLIVPAALLERACEISTAIMGGFVVGDPRDPATAIGPLVSAKQRDRALDIIASGEREGARRILGADTTLPKTGYFVPPTVFRDVDPSMRVAREEIFAPVLSIFPAHDDAEAIAIANDSEYGLAASVWASDHAHADAVAKVVDAGTLTINGGAFHPSAPYGGIKASGLGRELGVYGLEEFLEYRTYHGASA